MSRQDNKKQTKQERISVELALALKVLAASNNTSVRQLIEDAITDSYDLASILLDIEKNKLKGSKDA